MGLDHKLNMQLYENHFDILMNDPMSLDAFGIRHSLTIKALRSKSS